MTPLAIGTPTSREMPKSISTTLTSIDANASSAEPAAGTPDRTDAKPEPEEVGDSSPTSTPVSTLATEGEARRKSDSHSEEP